MDVRNEREKRLAEALRENLRRRKAQARDQDMAGAVAARCDPPVDENDHHK